MSFVASHGLHTKWSVLAIRVLFKLLETVSELSFQLSVYEVRGF